MGPNESHNYGVANTPRFKINRNHFEFQFVLGKGGFGKVWKVLFKKNLKFYALKEMSKVKIIDRKSEKSIKGERDFLSYLHHPFIVNMSYSFQDYENLYLAMDLLTGGDLRFHLTRHKTFTEEQSTCLLSGLEFIHNNKIIHRDIKPENLVCDENGYVRITDFGVAKKSHPDNANETSGTPGYMAPEVLNAQNHTFAVDYYAIGVMGYEFMKGERPYIGKSRKEIKHAIMKKQAMILNETLPQGWSSEAADFINRLLKRKEEKRLGFYKGVIELKGHKWFNGFDWSKLYNKTFPSPFIPNPSGNYDKRYCEAIEKLNPSTIERYQQHMKKSEHFDNCFKNYTFISDAEVSAFIGMKSARLITSSIDNHKTTMTTHDNETKSKGNHNNNNNDTNNNNPYCHNPSNSHMKIHQKGNNNWKVSLLKDNPHLSKLLAISKGPVNIMNNGNGNDINNNNNDNSNSNNHHQNYKHNLNHSISCDLNSNQLLLKEIRLKGLGDIMTPRNHDQNNNNNNHNNGSMDNYCLKITPSKLHLNLNMINHNNNNSNLRLSYSMKRLEIPNNPQPIPFQLPLINQRQKMDQSLDGNENNNINNNNNVNFYGKKTKFAFPIPLTNNSRKVYSLKKSSSTGNGIIANNAFMYNNKLSNVNIFNHK